MVKILTLVGILICSMLLSITTSAQVPNLPDLIITEIVADNASSDAYEYIELFNVSGKTINLYDYSIAYSSDLSSASFKGPSKQTAMVPGNFSTSLVDRSRGFNNPETFLMSPGEVVLIWFWSFDSYAIKGGLSDFRAYYQLSDDVRILVLDADNSAATGNSDRFNLQNSGNRGISLVRDGFALNAGYDGVVCMATLDYNKILPSMPDLSVVYGKSDNVSEPWRLTMRAFWAEPTPGKLTDAQKDEFGQAIGSDGGSAAPTADWLMFAVACAVLAILPFGWSRIPRKQP